MYFKGLELANGYHELTDAQEQKKRFENELVGTNRPLDQKLLAAMTEHKLPECSGVALGVDRVLMLQQQRNSISEVLSFDFNHC